MGTPTTRANAQIGRLWDCTFKFTVGGVPAGERFYEVTVGEVEVGTFSEVEVREGITFAA